MYRSVGRFACLLGLVLPVAVAASAQKQAAPPARTVLKGADCLDPSAARGWQYIDSNELLVDAGRRRYRIGLSESCTDLGHAPDIGFRGDSISGRVCGNIGERVVLQRMSCRIDRVELIDKATYKAASGHRRGTVSAGAPVR